MFIQTCSDTAQSGSPIYQMFHDGEFVSIYICYDTESQAMSYLTDVHFNNRAHRHSRNMGLEKLKYTETLSALYVLFSVPLSQFQWFISISSEDISSTHELGPKKTFDCEDR